MDPRGFPSTLPEFQTAFPDDAACATYLEKLRWPDGFSCSKCGWRGEPYRFGSRSSVVLRCRGCKDKGNVSLTAGTVMHRTHMPLSMWFWGAYLVTTQTPGQSALQFQRQLGIATYETAFAMLHKLRAGMVRPERDAIGGEHAVEVDECLVGGATRGEGRGVHHKATVVGAVEVRIRKDAEDRTARYRQKHDKGIPLKKLVYAGRLRLRVVSGLPSMTDMLANPLSGRGADVLCGFVRENVAPGSTVRTDGWIGYRNLPSLGYKHESLVLGGDPEKTDGHLPMIHLVFSNLKTWLRGTHHGVSQQHLQSYLNEFVFRFNRRFYPMTAFDSVLGLAVRSEAPTYAALYSGEWAHPAA
jgi:hypothetical protein